MQVFIIGTPIETATVLDKKRLNKQIVECSQILSALHGKSAWRNHPCVLQYKEHVLWLYQYKQCLEQFAMGCVHTPQIYSEFADKRRPPFHTQEYFDQMKRRLYTKNPEHYKQWAHLGESQVNWYWSKMENKFIKYENGKRIE